MSSLLLASCGEKELPSVAPPAPSTTASAPSPTPTKAPEPIVLKFSTSSSPMHPAIGGTVNFLAEEFEKRTEGRVKMEIFWSSALNPMSEGFNSVVSGVAVMCDSIAGWCTRALLCRVYKA